MLQLLREIIFNTSRSFPLIKDSHAFIDENRLLLGDKYGKLVLLTLTHSGSQNRIKSLALHLLGEVSIDDLCDRLLRYHTDFISIVYYIS